MILQQVECEAWTWTWTHTDGKMRRAKEKRNAFPKLIPNDNIKFNSTDIEPPPHEKCILLIVECKTERSVLKMRHRHGLIPYTNIWLKSWKTDTDDDYNITICILNSKSPQTKYVHFPTYPTPNFQKVLYLCDGAYDRRSFEQQTFECLRRCCGATLIEMENVFGKQINKWWKFHRELNVR